MPKNPKTVPNNKQTKQTTCTYKISPSFLCWTKCKDTVIVSTVFSKYRM